MQWTKTYAASGTTSQFGSVRQTSDGGYVFAGYLDNESMYEPYSPWIVKTDSSGNVQWQKTYGATGEDGQFQGIGLTSDGGFVATRWTLQFNGQLEAYVVRTDSLGNVGACLDVQSTSAAEANAAVASSPAGLSLTSPADSAPSMAAAATIAVSTTLSKEC